MNLEDKMKNRFNKNLDNVVKNPYSKKKAFPLWAKVTIPLGGALTVGLVAAIVLPIALSNKTGINYTPNLNQMKQLRSPEELSHEYPYDAVYQEGYKEFKSKLQSFSSSLSESFVDSQYDSNDNIVFSPLSIELCLGLAVRSSDGNTRKELLNAFGVDYETFNTYYKLFFNENTKIFHSNHKEYQGELSLTNSIWIDNEINLLDSGLDALRDDYYCYSYEADFNHQNEKTNKAIKEFINQKTHGLINPDLQLSPETLFILMNTLYMKDIWNEDADELTETNSYKFKNANGEYSDKKLLSGYYKRGKTLVKEDYSSFYTTTHHGIKFNFIKPNDGKTIKEVFNKTNIDYVLDGKNYTYRDGEKMEEYYTNCIFPEYTAESNLDFKDILRYKHGINDLFTPSCNFSNLTNLDVMCNSVTHVAKLVVNKKGTEGAAVTIIDVMATAAPYEEYKKVCETFVVDQEFGYVVSYNNNVLFSGIVSNIDK